tara:strand:+ start:811 stop:3504 length:2694 start_codon:yes stop_codon:yes gene_type:complete
MKRFLEARGDTAVFTFGRFNPPTTGHEKLIDALAKQQSKNAGSLMYVYPSHSQDAKKNPLPHARKIAYMKKMFRKYAKNIITSKSRNVFEIATELHNKGHRAVVMVVGSDRVAEFDNLLNKYNGVEGKHGYYGFDDIRVVSAGDRDPDAEGVEGMSASKMRAAAAQGDFDSFQMGVPRNFGDAKKLYDDVRKNMGIREQNWTDEEILRDAYIRGEIWNVGDVVETTNGDLGVIVRKGTNYVVFEKNMRKVWLHDLVEEPKKITKTKQEKDIEDIKGTQPAKYYAKGVGDKKDMKKSTKVARARQFNRQAKMDDDDPKAYKPAPGDKGAKTKPSQYTKKFKQMYGEQEKEKKPAQSDQAKKRDEFEKLQKAKRIAALQYRMAKDAETVAKMSQTERKLTDAEKDKLKKYEKDIDKKDFIDRYGKEEGESIYYATLTKMAKGESLWANIHKKRQRIKRGSGERMRKKGEKGAPTPAQMKRAKGESNESYEIGKDYFDHTKEIDPYSAPEETNEKSTLKKDKKLPNLMIPKKGKAGQTKFMRRKNLQKLAADVQAEIDEQPEHEITVGNYTTKHFYMCGSAQELMKKNADRVGAEELTRLQDDFYKLEAEIMNSGEPATGLQKQKAQKIYNQIMNQAAEMELADDMSGYMKSHLDSVMKGDPKPGFGRTDLKEDFQLDEKIAGLVKKSDQTGVPYGILKKSYDRGMAAWKTGHRPGTTPQQWAFARVNSMLTGGKADPDLQAKIKKGGYKKKKKKASKESVEEWFSSDETIKLYQERYGDEWLKKLNNTYERMLSKLNEDDCSCYDHVISEAEYQGKKVKLNDPIRTSENPNKKFKVYVKNEKGKVVVVRFGDPNMDINRDDPERRKSFRARHNCDDPGPKTKARYWSCFQWRAGAKVDN